LSTESLNAISGVAEGQTAVPEQNADVARPQDDANEGGDQSQESTEDKGLTDEQRTIRKLQRRIDRLTAKRGASEREVQILREELSRAKVAGQESEEGEPERKLSEADIERLAEQKAAEKLKQRSVAQRVDSVLKTGKALEGFDAAVNAVADEVAFTDKSGRPTPFIEAVLDADDPAAVLHYLGNNPDEAAEFADLTASQIGRRLAKLELKLKPEGKERSSAPAPLKPVKAVGITNKALSELSLDDFMKRRKEQIAKRR